MFIYNFFNILEQSAKLMPDKTAVIDNDEELSYAELAQRSCALASWLYNNRVRRGDRIGIYMQKSLEEIVATFAIARLGCVFVNINYSWTLHQLKYIINDCGIRVLFTDMRRARIIVESELIDKLDTLVVLGIAPDHPKIVTLSDFPNNLTIPENPSLDVDLAAILYTSGSTGMPKGVMLSNMNLIQGARSVAKYLNNNSEDIVIASLPINFDYGLNQITTMFLVGGTVVLQRVVMPSEIIKTIISKRVTGLATVPPTWIQIVRYLKEVKTPLPSLRYITNTGGRIPYPILEAMPEVFPGVDIYLMYGLTEAFRSTYLSPELFMEKMGSIGRAIPNVEVFIVDPSKGLCEPGQVGELIHRGSLICQGYWGNPEASAENIKVCEHLKPIIGNEKTLYSGDLIRIDEDEYLWFVGRTDEMIKCSGYRLSPTEVEDVVYKSGLVGEVVAFGVEDELLGQVVHIVISLLPGEEISTVEVLNYCKRNMPNYMVPRQIYLWDGEMPRTSNGKIDRLSIIRTFRSES